MYEDIEDNGGMRRYSYWRLWHEKTLREDYGARRLCGFVVSFSSLLSHRNHRTVKWGPSELSQSDWSDAQLKSYVFERRQWEQILSRAGWVSFACSPSKVAACVWNLTVGTRVSSLVTQGHFGQIRSGCLVAINSPPPTPQICGYSEFVHGFCRLRATHLEVFERENLVRTKPNTPSQRVLGITEVFLSVWPENLLHLRTVYPLAG